MNIVKDDEISMHIIELDDFTNTTENSIIDDNSIIMFVTRLLLYLIFFITNFYCLKNNDLTLHFLSFVLIFSSTLVSKLLNNELYLLLFLLLIWKSFILLIVFSWFLLNYLFMNYFFR